MAFTDVDFRLSLYIFRTRGNIGRYIYSGIIIIVCTANEKLVFLTVYFSVFLFCPCIDIYKITFGTLPFAFWKIKRLSTFYVITVNGFQIRL